MKRVVVIAVLTAAAASALSSSILPNDQSEHRVPGQPSAQAEQLATQRENELADHEAHARSLADAVHADELRAAEIRDGAAHDIGRGLLRRLP